MAADECTGLISLMLTAGFSWSQLLRIAEEYLGMLRLDAETEMDGGSLEERITRLVHWADRHGQLSSLTNGVMLEAQGNYAVRQWITSGGVMPSGPTGEQSFNAQVWVEIKFDIAQIKTDVAQIRHDQQQIRHDQQDMRNRVSTIESTPRQQSPAIDRVMVALLALVMFGMLAFNLVSVLR